MEVFAKIIATSELVSVQTVRNGVQETISKREIVLQTLETRQSQQTTFCAPQVFVATLFGQQAEGFPTGQEGAYVCAQLSFSGQKTNDGKRWFQNVNLTRYAFPQEQQV